MSHDGSSCKSYIKHPTEKERLDNLAFTSFPEDYLPYTSAYHQQGVREGGKAPPYLVWEERRSRRSRKRRRGCCSTAALVSAIALIVAAILAVVAISVYLGVVTNLFRSPVLSLSGKFRVTNGDEFSDDLLNVTSYQFLIKAETYQAMVENVFLSSSLEPAFIAARIYAFRPGMLVFFRVYLDRRKLKQDDTNTIEIVKDLIRTDSPAFGALIVDQESVEVDENEEWLAAPGLDLRIAKMSTTASKPITPRPDSKPSSSSKATEYPRRPVLATRKPKKPPTSSPALTPSSIDPGPVREISGTGTGHVVAVGAVNPEEDSHFSYGQWRPVPIEDSVSPSFGDQRTPPGRGSVRLLDESSPSQAQRPQRPSSGSSPLHVGIGSVKVLEDPLSHVDPAPIPVRNSRPLRPIISDAQRGEVASSIMSSVSLVVRQPNKKNQTSVLPESGRLEMARPIQNKTKHSDTERPSVTDDSAFVNRNDHASYRFLEKIESAATETTYSTDSSDWLDASSTFDGDIIGLVEEKNIQDTYLVPSNLQDTELHQEIHKSITVNIKSEKYSELKESQIPVENTHAETTQSLLITQELKENVPNKELFGPFSETTLSEANPDDNSLAKINSSNTNSSFTTYDDVSSTVDYSGDLAELDLSTNIMNEEDEQEINIQSLKSDIGINSTHLLKYTTINSYTAPTENVELIDVLLLDEPDLKNESVSNTTVKGNLKPFFTSTEESEDISMVTSTISHILHKSGNVTNEGNETDSVISVHSNNSQQMLTLNIAETITEKEDSYDSNENSATEDISLYISELNMTEKTPSLVTHSVSETKLHTIRDLGESLNNFSVHTLEGHGFHKPHFSLTTMSPAKNAEKHFESTSQSAATEELTTLHHNFVKSSDTPKEVTNSKDKITASTPDPSDLDSSKLALNSDSIDSSAVYTDASAYGSSQSVEGGSLSTINHQANDEITSFPAVQSNETSENISTDISENVTSSDSLITNRNEDGLNVTTVILSGVPKIVPQFSALHFNPNDIESDDGGIIELDDDLMHEQHTTQSDQDTIKDKTEIIRHITTLAPTTVMPVSLGKYPIFISKSCSEDEMLCDSGECVESNSRCNMRRDCRDNSDEKNCTCTDLLRVLGQSQKICDGVEDCQDRSDEQNCPWCKAGQYICPQTKFCINRTQVCDGHDDCPLGNDEKYCVRLADSVPDAESLHYRSSGYLMVRKKGQWGKLCLESVQDSLVLRRKLDELGKAVCTTLTYKDMSESKRVHDTTMGSEFYYEISSDASREVRKSTTIFQQSMCKSKDVIKVECGDLECGIRPMVIANRRRIVGGQSTVSGSWPWQVALYKEGDFQCGAVLISDTWLISAGHCFYSTQTAYWTARLGLLRRGSELPSPSEEIRRIEQIILHPDYEDQGFINDIALLKMDKPVMFSDYLRPVCLPTESEDAGLWHGKQCSVVGWGKLYEIGHTFPDSLQEVRLPVISTEECRKKIIFLTMYHLTDNMFCAGYERGGRDACLGDSGGPLMCQRNDGRWLLLGVTSNGDGCGRPNRPGVYTKVTQYLSWIRTILDKQHTNVLFEDKCDGIRCKLGRCIPQYKVCDGRWDCSEGSDENHCED